ncbi:hypothetical protein [Streptomyces sp. NPDC058297]|uniref:hypothetical protein n=1 Tax=Streptomyces sp. NPDC058297 TaxID=3346433 RepID=UPI0036E47C0B
MSHTLPVLSIHATTEQTRAFVQHLPTDELTEWAAQQKAGANQSRLAEDRDSHIRGAEIARQELTARSQPAATGPQVWIVMTGELGDGGRIIGVYATRNLARGAFIEQAEEIHDRFSIDEVEPHADGSISISGGCDWVELSPHTVVSMSELSAP